jgi:S1-C subfamily serine protease
MMRDGRGGPAVLLSLLRALLAVALPIAASAAQLPAHVRVVRVDSLRDSTLMRVSVNTESIERMIRELLASREIEQAIAISMREAMNGEKGETRRFKLLTDSLGRIAKRNEALVTKMQMQCTSPQPLPEGYLGISFEETQITQHDNEPAMYELGAVESVTPGSPADKSGILRGDMLLSIGGVDARKPIALGSILKPGRRVPVRLQRGRSTKDVTVLVEKRPAEYGSDCATLEQWIGPSRDAPVITFRTPSPGSAPRAVRAPDAGMPPDTPMPPPAMAFSFGYTPMAMSTLIAGAALKALDDDWRASTGVDNGVLVISVAQGSPAKEAGLRGSDVIVSADDQTVGSPRALSRIISNAKANAVKLQIIRAGKPLTLTLRWHER